MEANGRLGAPRAAILPDPGAYSCKDYGVNRSRSRAWRRFHA